MKDLMEGLHEDQKPSRSTLKESDLAEIKKIQSMRATPSLQSLGLTSSSLRRSLRDTNQFSKNSEDYENSQFQYNNTNQRPSTTSSSINYKTQSKVPFKITSIDDGIYPSNNSTPQNSPRGNSNNTSKDFPIPSESSSLSSSISQSINNSNNNKEFRNENSLATKKSLSSSIVSIEDYLKKISKNNFEEFCNETLNNNNNNKEFYSTNNSMKNTKNNTINKKNNTIEINKNILFNNNISLKLNYLANNNDEMKKNKQEYLENKKLDSFNKSKKWHNEYLERKNVSKEYFFLLKLLFFFLYIKFFYFPNIYFLLNLIILLIYYNNYFLSLSFFYFFSYFLIFFYRIFMKQKCFHHNYVNIKNLKILWPNEREKILINLKKV